MTGTTRQFLVRADLLRAGAGGFAAHVEDVHARCQKTASLP
jgi:hypothetical protein